MNEVVHGYDSHAPSFPTKGHKQITPKFVRSQKSCLVRRFQSIL